MRAFISGILATVLTAGITFSASAQTREDAYIAARDAAVARIKAAADAEKRGPMDGYLVAFTNKESAEHALKDYPGKILQWSDVNK